MGPAKEMPTGPLQQSMDADEFEDPEAEDYIEGMAEDDRGVS
jgi:hypothetical protein